MRGRADTEFFPDISRPAEPPLTLPSPHFMGRGFKIAALLLCLAAPAIAQDRVPAQRQALIDLAYVLGESHALRQACEGQADQFWRDRMRGLVRAETPGADLDRRLKTAFNTGFVAGQSTFPACGRANRREQARLAARGRALSASLTGAMANDDPSR